MAPDQIKQGQVYFSIHGVPYRVTKRTGDTVLARCANGRGQLYFEMPVERFAESMARPSGAQTADRSVK